MKKKVLGENHSDMLVNFTQGLDVDKFMYKEELKVQRAWVTQLQLDSYINADELTKFLNALSEIETEIQEDIFSWNILDEDIHMNIERVLTEKLGDLGKKIHLGRSRNDLVATTQRLFVQSKVGELSSLLKNLISTICDKASENIDVIIPGMTHQQSGQPVRYSHTLLAHGHAFKRDITKLKNVCEICVDSLPLGAAAFSGTHLSLNLENLAKELGFNKALQNSYDAVGDRDFILEALNSFATLAVHMTRLCNEIIYNSSTSVGLINLPINWTTGSSIMPNKRNPDTIEITRAKMARVIAAASEGLNLVSSVVPSYGSDLHELKRTFVRSFSELKSSVDIMIPFIKELSINKEVAKNQLEKGHILATDFANLMTENNQGKFRESYLKTKETVEEAHSKGCQVHELDNWPAEISFEYSVEQRKLTGGTSKASCLSQIRDMTD